MSWTFLLKVWPLFRCSCMAAFGCSLRHTERGRSNSFALQKRCGACSLKAQCSSGRYKYLTIHRHEPARQRARELANTPAFASAPRARKKVEALFAELKHRMGVRHLRLRRLKFVREQFFLAAAAQLPAAPWPSYSASVPAGRFPLRPARSTNWSDRPDPVRRLTSGVP
jgi:hypothetical protein